MSNRENLYSRFKEIQCCLRELSPSSSSNDVKKAAIVIRRYEKDLPVYEDISSFNETQANEMKIRQIGKVLNIIKLSPTKENSQSIADTLFAR